MEIDTYEKLSIFIDRWVTGTIDLLIIESEAGLGKSCLIKGKLKEKKHLAINNHITPLMNYKQLYENRDRLVWFDDVYYLLLNKLNVALLKQVCETSEIKKLCYYTTSELMGETPKAFTTSSKVLISCNSIEGNSPHIKAIKDRGFHLVFKPSRVEILHKMQEIVDSYPYLEIDEKQAIFEVIRENSKFVKEISLRTLIKGFQLYNYYKSKGIDWKEDFLKELHISEKMIKISLLMEKYDNDLERLKEWGWSRQTFYIYKGLVEKV